MLTPRQIRTHLQHYRYDPALAENPGRSRSRRKVPLNAICSLARLDSRAVKSFIAGATDDNVGIGQRGLEALSRVVEQIESGEVRFFYNDATAIGSPTGEPKVGVEYVRKPDHPHIQDRLTRFEDHREWARCRTCQGDKWNPVEVHGALHYACRSCWPAGNLAAIGGRTIADSRLEVSQSAMRENFSVRRKGKS
jgi:hypothetical protein